MSSDRSGATGGLGREAGQGLTAVKHKGCFWADEHALSLDCGGGYSLTLCQSEFTVHF